jgi:hypothetical protein
VNRDSVAAEVDIELGNSLNYRTTLASPTGDQARTYELFTTFLRGTMATTSVVPEKRSSLRPS